MPGLSKWLVTIVLLIAADMIAAGEVDPDELPRNPVLLPDGTKTYHVRYLHRNWREATSQVLQTRVLHHPEDVCFEAKFADISDGVLKLLSNSGRIICNDPQHVRYAQRLLRGDNIWLCGILKAREDGNGVEFHVEDIRKMKGDLQRAQSHFARLQERKDAKGLISLGNDISKILTSNMYDFNEHDQFLELRTKAWTRALLLMEKQLGKDDAAGLYALALKWKDLLHKTHKYHQTIRKVLKIDSTHHDASRIAVEEIGLVKFRGKWMTKDKKVSLVEKEREKQDKIARSERETKAAAAKRFEEAKANRFKLLTKYQVSLRTRDVKALERAYRSLGEAIRNSPDEDFGRRAIEILGNVGDPYAVWPGLDMAVKTELPSVRCHAFRTLAWLGTENALEVLATSVQAEKDIEAARICIKAIVTSGGKPRRSIKALVSGLSNPDKAIVDAVVNGLRKLTGLKHADKDAWVNWWSENSENEKLPIARDEEDAK
jgi:hypothetical protein